MNIFELHGARMRDFHREHAENRDVAVAERESFDEHDEKMKFFRRSHRDISEDTATNTGGTQKSLNRSEWAAFFRPESNSQHGLSLN